MEVSLQTSRDSFSVTHVSKSSRVGTMEEAEQVDTTPELTNQLLSFCPRSLSLVPGVGSSRVLNACVMLVDIVGFTELSYTLCTEGLTGIDKLRLVTNNTLAHFINTIHNFDGDGIIDILSMSC